MASARQVRWFAPLLFIVMLLPVGASSGPAFHAGRFAPYVDVSLEPTFALVRDAHDVGGHATIDPYAFTSLDFDVEGAALTEAASIDLRNKAIAALEIANPGVRASYTLPVLPSGLTQDGVNLLSGAIANGARVDTVNIMTVDYGRPDGHMGRDAIAAADATLAQLSKLYPGNTPAELRAMLGVTPMIGHNDSSGEIFSLADATTLRDDVTTRGFGRVSMWSAARDRSCGGAVAFHPALERGSGRRVLSDASSECSGIVQKPWAFSAIFRTVDK
jgi:chitinase